MAVSTDLKDMFQQQGTRHRPGPQVQLPKSFKESAEFWPNRDCLQLMVSRDPVLQNPPESSTHLPLQVSARCCPAASCTWSQA